MDDLVERWNALAPSEYEKGLAAETQDYYDHPCEYGYAGALVDMFEAGQAFLARITELETALAEAEGRVKELEALAVSEREDNLWNAYAVGHEADGLWTHLSMSDAEDLVRQCGLDVKARYYDASAIKAAIPAVARNVLPIRALASDPLLDRQGKEGI